MKIDNNMNLNLFDTKTGYNVILGFDKLIVSEMEVVDNKDNSFSVLINNRYKMKSAYGKEYHAEQEMKYLTKKYNAFCEEIGRI